MSRVLAAFRVILYFFIYHNCYFNRIEDSHFMSLSSILIFVKATSLILSASHSPPNLQRVNILNILFNFVRLCISFWYTFAIDTHRKVEHRGFLWFPRSSPFKALSSTTSIFVGNSLGQQTGGLKGSDLALCANRQNVSGIIILWLRHL